MNPPVVFGVRSCGNRALRTALGLGTFMHPDDPRAPKMLKSHPAIVPLRDPFTVAVSWYFRAGFPHPSMIEKRFERLFSMLERVEHRFVCMDQVDRRREQLAAIAERFGVEGELGPVPERNRRLSFAEFRRLLGYVLPVYRMPLIAEFYTL